MFRSINQKFYSIVGLLTLSFCLAYAQVAYFLGKQARVDQQGQRMISVDREIRHLRESFFEMRFWERAVFTQEYSDAEQRFGTLMAELKAQLSGLDKQALGEQISGQLAAVSDLLGRYEADFNRLFQINTEQRIHITRFDSSYQSLASSILSLRKPNLLKPLFVLTQFQRSYIAQHRESEYHALGVVIDSLQGKLLAAGVLDERLASYVEEYRAILKLDMALEREAQAISTRFDQTSTALTAELAAILSGAEVLVAEEFVTSDAIRKRLTGFLLFSTALSLLILLVVIALVAQKVVEPVRAVARVIGDVQDGNMSARFDPEGYGLDEIVQLGLMFNKLLDTLAEKGAQLARYQGDLEGKVRELAQRDQEQESLIGELEAKNTELERFTYTVSHDLKSPLITIQGFLGFLESDARNGEWDRVRNDCQRIQSATSRMQQLLNDLLELSRIGRLVNQPEQVPFAVLAREAVERIAERLNPKHVQVEIEDSMPRVWVDRHRLSEVLDNLLDNAVKAVASQNSPRIEIGCRTGGGDPTFFVRDNGVGIEPAYHQKVFGLFEKLDESVEGTGVGLAIVKRIIEVHRGRIWVESDGPGQGSSFCFTLPMYTVDAMAEEVHCGG